MNGFILAAATNAAAGPRPRIRRGRHLRDRQPSGKVTAIEYVAAGDLVGLERALYGDRSNRFPALSAGRVSQPRDSR
jgi:hypothetical protein